MRRDLLQEPHEAELIERLRRRDLDALGDLYRELGDAMTTLARSILRERAEADDVVEEALLRIHAAAPNFRGPRGLRTWTLRIVANLCRDRLRRRRFSAGAPDDLDPLGHAGLVVHETESRDARIDRERLLAELERALADLPLETREAIVLCDRMELTYEDAAETLGVSLPALKSRLFRGRQRLRERLKHFLEE